MTAASWSDLDCWKKKLGSAGGIELLLDWAVIWMYIQVALRRSLVTSAGLRWSWVLAWMIKEVRVAMISATYVRLNDKQLPVIHREWRLTKTRRTSTILFNSSTVRASNTAALSRYSFHNGSSFRTSPFKILFHISDGVAIGVVDSVNGAEKI